MSRPLLAAVAGVLVLAACVDSPTAPTSYVQRADGRTWVAVTIPDGVPDVKTWLPYLSPAAVEEIHGVQEEAGRARRAGELERALELTELADRRAAESVASAPSPQALLASAAALDSWTERAEARLEAGSFPGLDSAVVEVRARTLDSRRLLARGDTSGAVLALARGAEAAREYAPMSVGLRLLGRLEVRLDGYPHPSQNVLRARKLLRNAREGLATGQTGRALKCAVYALQLLEMEDSAGARVAR